MFIKPKSIRHMATWSMVLLPQPDPPLKLRRFRLGAKRREGGNRRRAQDNELFIFRNEQRGPMENPLVSLCHLQPACGDVMGP